MIQQPIYKTEVHYNDFWIKIIGSLVASEMIDSIGREESIFKRVTHPYFYTDLLGGFIISLILWEIVRFVIRRLDKKYNWIDHPAHRISLQFLFAIVVPAFLCFVFTLLFMKLAYNQDIFKTEWLYNEFYVVILIIVIINLVYFTWWLFIRWQALHGQSLVSQDLKTNGDAAITNRIPEPAAIITVTKAGKNILLPQTEITYVVLEGSYTFIKTLKGESFVTTYTLDELTKMMDPDSFFRANRQIIVSRNACKAYENIENGKISIDLSVDVKSPVIVSQKRAKAFRNWISAMAMT
jgi:DNA-binding LytR/AlgR family response regulator